MGNNVSKLEDASKEDIATYIGTIADGRFAQYSAAIISTFIDGRAVAVAIAPGEVYGIPNMLTDIGITSGLQQTIIRGALNRLIASWQITSTDTVVTSVVDPLLSVTSAEAAVETVGNPPTLTPPYNNESNIDPLAPALGASPFGASCGGFGFDATKSTAGFGTAAGFGSYIFGSPTGAFGAAGGGFGLPSATATATANADFQALAGVKPLTATVTAAASASSAGFRGFDASATMAKPVAGAPAAGTREILTEVTTGTPSPSEGDKICAKCQTAYKVINHNKDFDCTADKCSVFEPCEGCGRNINCNRENLHILMKRDDTGATSDLCYCIDCCQNRDDDMMNAGWKCDECDEEDDE